MFECVFFFSWLVSQSIWLGVMVRLRSLPWGAMMSQQIQSRPMNLFGWHAKAVAWLVGKEGGYVTSLWSSGQTRSDGRPIEQVNWCCCCTLLWSWSNDYDWELWLMVGWLASKSVSGTTTTVHFQYIVAVMTGARQPKKELFWKSIAWREFEDILGCLPVNAMFVQSIIRKHPSVIANFQ